MRENRIQDCGSVIGTAYRFHGPPSSRSSVVAGQIPFLLERNAIIGVALPEFERFATNLLTRIGLCYDLLTECEV